jgi:hypothetical protein
MGAGGPANDALTRNRKRKGMSDWIELYGDN